MSIQIDQLKQRLEVINGEPVTIETVDKLKKTVLYNHNGFTNLEILETTLRKQVTDIDTLSEVLTIFEGYKRIIKEFELCRLKLGLYCKLAIEGQMTVEKMIETECAKSVDRLSELANSSCVVKTLAKDEPVALMYDNQSVGMVIV